ncbi:helix-turn-helix domain-containing protein [Afipia felis]
MRTKLPGKKHVHHQKHLKACTLDHWYVSLPFRSRNGGQKRDTENPAPRIHCLAAPFDRQINHDGLLSLFIPQDLLPATAALDRMLGMEMNGAPGRLLAEFMFLLNESMPHLRTAQVPYLMEATRNLVVACLDASPGRMIVTNAPIDATLLARARRLIDARLADLDFNSETVCATLGVSRSRLYRIFQPFGGVACYIRKQRLSRTRNALSDAADTRSISRIAEQWGFTDASGYSRAFRREFGMSPRQARDRAWIDNGYSLRQRRLARSGDGQTLYDLLRALT